MGTGSEFTHPWELQPQQDYAMNLPAKSCKDSEVHPDFSYKCELALNLCSKVGLMAEGFVEQEGQKGTPECFVCLGQWQHGQQYGAQALQLGRDPLGSCGLRFDLLFLNLFNSYVTPRKCEHPGGSRCSAAFSPSEPSGLGMEVPGRCLLRF